MKQMHCAMISVDKNGTKRTSTRKMKFSKADQMYVHPDNDRIKVPDSNGGLFVYNTKDKSWRIQSNDEFDIANEIIIFATPDKGVVDVFGMAHRLGCMSQEWYENNKSSLILPGIN